MSMLCMTLFAAACVVVSANSHRLCGRRLTEALTIVCDHKYHRPTRAQLNIRRSHSSGLATKCCRYRCSYEDLRQYCSVAEKKKMRRRIRHYSRLLNRQLHRRAIDWSDCLSIDHISD